MREKKKGEKMYNELFNISVSIRLCVKPLLIVIQYNC